MQHSPRLFKHVPTADSHLARLTIDASNPSAYRVSPLLFGKFCEHLGTNIYNGMEAQILFNPTFGHWVFDAAENDLNRIDGGTAAEGDRARIAARIQVYAERLGWPSPAWLMEGYKAGAAFGWVPLGEARLSPDVGPHGGRAQRVEALAEAAGIAQRHLPAHPPHTRVRVPPGGPRCRGHASGALPGAGGRKRQGGRAALPGAGDAGRRLVHRDRPPRPAM